MIFFITQDFDLASNLDLFIHLFTLTITSRGNSESPIDLKDAKFTTFSLAALVTELPETTITHPNAPQKSVGCQVLTRKTKVLVARAHKVAKLKSSLEH